MPEKILIADDIGVNRLICKSYMAREFPEFDYELFESGDSLEARLNEDVKGIRIIITDNDMPPGPKGVEIIEKYSKELGYTGAKFILYSSDPREDVEKKATSHGAFYLQKPIDKEILIETVRKALE